MPVNPTTPQPIQVAAAVVGNPPPSTSSARVDAPTAHGILPSWCYLPHESDLLQVMRIGKIPRFGGIPLIRPTLFRALVLSAALAGALTPVRCLGEGSSKLPEWATRELSPELLSLLRQKKMSKHSPIILRVFKKEAELEVWKQDTTGHFQILKTYPICRWSGDLGPKLRQGDRQTPEGFYTITPKLINPNSNFYLAI